MEIKVKQIPSNYVIVKIAKKSEKIPRDLRIFAVTQKAMKFNNSSVNNL